MKIYKIPVVEVLDDEPMVRMDKNDDSILQNRRRQGWKAVLDEIVARHEKGQPVLVGTVSVEVSEMISEALKRDGIKHAVLNAKPEHAEREAEPIAQAGRKGEVMIATNMAGRGVDIKLGGDPEHLAHPRAEKAGHHLRERGLPRGAGGEDRRAGARCKAEAEEVRELGGLFICGTERHESRRIDNQLRGRSGRQGDPGESRFFLSAEDDVIRLFAGDRIYKILDRLGPVDDDGERNAARGEDADQDRRERPEEGRGAELPDPQTRARVRRRDERAAPRRLQIPPRDPRRARHLGDRPRRDRGRDRAPGRRVHLRRPARGMGSRRAGDAAAADLAGRHRRRHAGAGDGRPREAQGRPRRRRDERLRRPRGGSSARS